MKLRVLSRAVLMQICPRKNNLDPRILSAMLDRSWFFGIFYVLSGYSALLVGKDAISIDPVCSDGIYDNCVGPYNEILDRTKDVMVIAIHIVMMLYVVSCIFCIKFRWLAHYHVYYILITRVLFPFVPTAEYFGVHPFLHCVNAIVVYLAHYCGSVYNIYCITIVTLFEMVFGVHIAYNREIGWKEALMVIVYAIITFFLMAAFGAVFDHVSQLYSRLDFINDENMKLLNGMHEGVLILSKPNEH